MFGWKSLLGILVAGWIFGLLVPVVGLMYFTTFLILLVMLIKMKGLDAFIRPLGPKENLMLWVTKTRKIIPQIVYEAEEGYLNLPEWGKVKVVQDSDYYFMGKPCVVGLQGVAYTVRMEDVKTAEILEEKHGIHTKEELKKFLEKKGEENGEQGE